MVSYLANEAEDTVKTVPTEIKSIHVAFQTDARFQPPKPTELVI